MFPVIEYVSFVYLNRGNPHSVLKFDFCNVSLVSVAMIYLPTRHRWATVRGRDKVEVKLI